MFDSGRYLYVFFCCQQAIEKGLKAVIVKETQDFPPRLHNLLRLAEVAGVSPRADYADFLGELSGYYIQTRYPEEMESVAAGITSESAQEALRMTQEVAEWLFSMLQ